MNFSKHLTDWLGVSTVELCGWKKRNLGGILRYVRPQKWGGGRRPPSAPLPWKVRGRAPPCTPLFLRLCLVCTLYMLTSLALHVAIGCVVQIIVLCACVVMDILIQLFFKINFIDQEDCCTLCPSSISKSIIMSASLSGCLSGGLCLSVRLSVCLSQMDA